MKEKFSFVIPCYKSQFTIESVVNEIRETVKDKNMYEIILVNDNSPDNTYEVICNLANADKNIKVINLSRNFGQASALMAGYRQVTGEIIISLDDDGQTPADECYKLIAELNNGYDVVYARYQEKKQSFFRDLGCIAAEIMSRVILEKPKDLYSSSYFVARRFVIDEITKYVNSYPYIGGLILRTTKNITDVKVNHREREMGKSGYTLKKLINLWLNGFTTFSVKPLRISTMLGFILSILGFIYGLWIIINKLFINSSIPVGYSSLICLLIIIGGAIMIMLGLIGEYIGRIYICINNSPQYVVKDKINCDKKKVNEYV